MDNDTIVKIAETLGRIDARLENVEKAVLGNGQPGLAQKVENLEASDNRKIGAIGVLGVLGASLWSFLEYIFHFRHGGQ